MVACVRLKSLGSERRRGHASLSVRLPAACAPPRFYTHAVGVFRITRVRLFLSISNTELYQTQSLTEQVFQEGSSS